MHRRGIEAFALMGFGIIVIKIRFFARIRTTGGFRKLQLDDYLMLIAGLAFAAEAYITYLATEVYNGYANSGISPEQRKALEPSSEEYRNRVGGCKTHMAGWQTYVFVLWTIKAAWCVFYLRLMGVLMVRRKVYFGFFLVISTWVAIVLCLLLVCRPLSRNWQIYPDPGPLCQPASSKVSIILVFVLNTVTDFYLMGIPIPMILATSFSRPKKFGLVLLFSGGAVVTVASTMRTIHMLREPESGGNLGGTWGTREIFVAILMSNIPQILPLLRRWFIPRVRKMSTRRQISESTTMGDGVSRVRTAASRSGSFPLEHKQSGHTVRRPRSPLALPTPTTDGEEDSGFEIHTISSIEQTEEACSTGRPECESEEDTCTCTNRESDRDDMELADGDLGVVSGE